MGTAVLGIGVAVALQPSRGLQKLMPAVGKGLFADDL